MMHQRHEGRRKFVQTGLLGFCSAILAGIPKPGFGQSPSNGDKGIVVRKSEGKHILTGRRKVPINIKISRAQQGIQGISFCVENQDPGRKMRVHKHLYNDELIFIHKGEGIMTLDEEKINVSTGDVVFIPRGTWHGLDNNGTETLEMVFQYSPAGFEEFFVENGTVEGAVPSERTTEEYEATGKKYGIVYKDSVK